MFWRIIGALLFCTTILTLYVMALDWIDERTGKNDAGMRSRGKDDMMSATVDKVKKLLEEKDKYPRPAMMGRVSCLYFDIVILVPELVKELEDANARMGKMEEEKRELTNNYLEMCKEECCCSGENDNVKICPYYIYAGVDKDGNFMPDRCSLCGEASEQIQAEKPEG